LKEAGQMSVHGNAGEWGRALDPVLHDKDDDSVCVYPGKLKNSYLLTIAFMAQECAN